MLGKRTRYQWPSVLPLAGNKRVVEIERDAEFPARAEDRYANTAGPVRDDSQEKAKENMDEIREGLYVIVNELPVSGRKEKRAYGNRGQSAQVSASQPWGKCERE